MTRHTPWGVFWLLTCVGCLNQPTLVSIDPDFAFVDGCQSLVLSGHHLGTDATARLTRDDAEIALDLTAAEYDDELPEHAQDVGFEYTATLGPDPVSGDQSGFWDVEMVVDEEVLLLEDGFYFVACDGITVEFGAPGGSYVAGDVVALEGCGLTDDLSLVLRDATCAVVGTTPLTSDCGTANVSAAIPAVADGDYFVTLENADGSTVFDFGHPVDPKDPKSPPCPGNAITVGGEA